MMRFAVLLIALTPAAAARAAEPADCELRFAIDDEAGKPLPCRIHLYDPAGKPVKPADLPFFRDHFVCSGRATLPVAAGKYRYEIERGPEHRRLAGTVEAKPGAPAAVAGKIGRIADLAAAGWFGGETHIHRPLKDVELLMAAEDLHVGPVITWWNRTNLWAGKPAPEAQLVRFDGNRLYHVMGGEDERGGGALLYFQLESPLAITTAAREDPPSTDFAAQARRSPSAHIDAEKPFWWDFPLWVSAGLCDTVGIANNHMNRSTVAPREAWGRARDQERLPDPMGNGLWTQEIYYHVLNCGIRLAPSAGSASGVLPNPVGYNRVYVHLDGGLDWAKWWQGLKAGRSFVTNGPLLLVTANGRLPGEVFASDSGPVEIKLDIKLTSPDRAPRLEIIRDGKAAETIDLGEGLEHHKTAAITFRESGWFLVRAITDIPQTFRFASTAPFYVEIGGKPRVSKSSAGFFVKWMDERIERLTAEASIAARRDEVLKPFRAARQWWADLAAKANAE